MGEKVEMVETDRWREAESLGPESLAAVPKDLEPGCYNCWVLSIIQDSFLSVRDCMFLLLASSSE